MPLMECPGCGRSVSRSAEFCPHCGEPIAGRRHGIFMRTLNCGCTVALVIGFALFMMVCYTVGTT